MMGSGRWNSLDKEQGGGESRAMKESIGRNNRNEWGAESEFRVRQQGLHQMMTIDWFRKMTGTRKTRQRRGGKTWNAALCTGQVLVD